MQTENLFELTYILLEKKQVTASEMAQHFGVSQRTIYRWVDALNLAGVPIYSSKGKGGGIRVSEKYAIDKTVFTEEEKQELMAGAKALENLSGNNVSAIAKLKTLTKKNADWIQIDFAPWNLKMTEIKDYFNILKDAIINGKKVQFEYFSSKGACGSRTVHPWKIIFRGQAWYLLGYCEAKNENRFFKLSRMKNPVILASSVSEEFQNSVVPEYDDFAYSNLENVTLKLKVQNQDVYRILDEFKVDLIEDSSENGENCKILTLTIPKFYWLIDYLLSFGSRLKVISPEEIRTELFEEYRRCMNNF